MARPLATCLVVALAMSACGRDPLSSPCEWTADAQRSLQTDALRAEDVAVRYADVTAGRRSGRRAGPIEYTRVRDECLSSVFGNVARVHRVSIDDVRAAAAQRPAVFDSGVLFSFALFYAFVAAGVVRWIRSRFTDSRIARVAITGGAAAMTATGGVLLGGVCETEAQAVLLVCSVNASRPTSVGPGMRTRQSANTTVSASGRAAADSTPSCEIPGS